MKRQQRYTLIEVLVAVAVLALMMSFLFQFTASAQRIWTATNGNMGISTNADVIFALLEEDLGQMVVDKEQGLKYTCKTITGDSTEFSFYTISNRKGGDGATDPQVGSLIYVKYSVDTAHHMLYRGQTNAENTASPLYAATDNTTPVTSVDLSAADGDDYMVADGVIGFKVTCRPAPTGTPATGDTLPNIVRVKVTLEQVAKSESDKSTDTREFSRTFFLGGMR